uniref:DNA-directed RNA polymerase subunit H (RpoH) n=1 Tax=uncultured marine group II/III euryarchaeote KM3_83_G03 TaxID=1456522 RepID=A0A075HT37_9EURY|nr:DNA-directed RNA polymerase subunit H (rpoH) [uncultured marine group II/III euryarchaeote KM3_83_G03]
MAAAKKEKEVEKSKPTRKAVKVVKKAPAKAKAASTAKTKVKDTSELVHTLVPKHIKLSDSDAKALFEKYHVTPNEMPKVMMADPAIRHLSAKEGDIIEIERASYTSGTIKFYRCVVLE